MKKEASIKAVQDGQRNKTFLDWYKEDRQTREKAAKTVWFWYMPMIVLFFIVAYWVVTDHIGDGAYSYNEYAYDDLSNAINESIYQLYSEEGEFEAAGIDEVKLSELVHGFTRRYEKDGVSTLECTKKDGYFVAAVTVDLDDSYNVVGTRRNFNSRSEYVEIYRLTVIFYTCILGFCAWFFIGAIGLIILKIIANVCEILEEKKKRHTDENEVSKIEEAENEDSKKSESETEKKKEETKLEVVNGTENVKTA